MPGCDDIGLGCLPRTFSREWQEFHSLCYKSANCKKFPETVCSLTVCKVEKLHIVSLNIKTQEIKHLHYFTMLLLLLKPQLATVLVL